MSLLLIYVFLRLQNLLTFPPFIDEMAHIDWARDLYRLHPFIGASNGKLFGLWWMALFGLYGNGALFVARAATILFSVVGAAALYSLGRHFAGMWGGALVVLFYGLSPYGFFYDRMALIDPYVATWAVLVVWLAVRFVTRKHSPDAVLCGVALFMAVLTKATGIALLVIPLLAYILLMPGAGWGQRFKGVALSYGVFAATWLPLYGVLRWRGIDYFATATTVVGASEVIGAEALWRNLGIMWAVDAAYFSLPFILVGIAVGLLALWWSRRAMLFLLGITLIPLGGLLVFGEKISARYFHFHVPLLLLAVVAASGIVISGRRRRVWRGGVVLLTLLWSGLFALPFQAQYLQNPSELDLPPLDRLEYIESDAAGFALQDVAEYLASQAEEDSAAVVMGILPNCAALDYYIRVESPIQVECPALRLDGSHQPTVVARIDELVRSGRPLWIVYEHTPFTSLAGITADLEEQVTFTRPGHLSELRVFRVAETGETL